MNAFIDGNISWTCGATRKTNFRLGACSNIFAYVFSSSQSKEQLVTVGLDLRLSGMEPEREARRTGREDSWKSLAMRRATLPVPPRRRMDGDAMS